MQKRRFIAIILVIFTLVSAVFYLTQLQNVYVTRTYAQDTTTRIYADNIGDGPPYPCEPGSPNEWHFVINQIDEEANAPGEIYVTWENGYSATLGLDSFTGGTAHYRSDSPPAPDGTVAVTEAYTDIYTDWTNGNGRFNLSHAPCEDPPTETPTATSTATSTDTPTATTTSTTTVTTTATKTFIKPSLTITFFPPVKTVAPPPPQSRPVPGGPGNLQYFVLFGVVALVVVVGSFVGYRMIPKKKD